VGFGCARLVGRSSLRRSAKLVEAALAVGIRYFDVAPVYGMGTAEEVLGEVLGNSKDVIVATKVGIPRPAYSARSDLARRLAKPALDRVRVLKTVARRFYAPKPTPQDAPRPRRDFSMPTILASVEDSLRRLRRDKIDLYLAHDPHASDIGPDLASRFESLVQSGQIAAYGAGVEWAADCPAPFGSVWQSRWPGAAVRAYGADVTYVFHGTIQFAPKDRLGATLDPPGKIVAEALRAAPRSIILVSTSTPDHLRDLVRNLT
jgi:hypothetical protein